MIPGTEEFEQFIQEHPEVYTLFVEFAEEAASRLKKIRADEVLHRVTWELLHDGLKGHVELGCRIKNWYGNRCAIKLTNENAKFKTFFDMCVKYN